MLFTISCSDDMIITEVTQPAWVTPTSADVSAAAGSCEFELRESLSELKVTSDQTWCTPAVNEEKITATFTQNDRNATRTAILAVTRNGEPFATLAVVQSRAALSLPDDPGIVKLKAATESVSVAVACDVEWTAHSKADWLTLTPQQNVLIITPTQNPTEEVRKERITLSVGEITKSFTVEQEGGTISLSNPAVELYAVANTRTVDITANVQWEATSNAAWLTASNDRGELVLTSTRNDGISRSAEVMLIAGSIRKAVKVKQFSAYESLLGSWTIVGVSLKVSESGASLVPTSYKVTLLEDIKDKSFLLDGYGAGYLASTTKAPFTINFEAATSSVSITMGEEVGTFVFDGFSADPEGKALVKTVFMQLISTDDGKIKIDTSILGGEIVNGSVSSDLNTITFETNKGMGFGMWASSTKEWSGFFCSYRMFNIVLSRATVNTPSNAPAQGSNQFIYVGR